VLLGHREAAAVLVDHAGGGLAQEDLAEEVGDALERGAPAYAHHPLTVDRRFGETGAPEGVGKRRARLHQLAQVAAWNERDFDRRERRDRMVHGQEQPLQVSDLTRQMERQDLAAPVGKRAMAEGLAFDHHVTVSRSIALARDVLARSEPLH
jgi:hypothetical protein